ncbi:MAG: DUF3445 domain-containing protein [Pseudomonadota bacterium]
MSAAWLLDHAPYAPFTEMRTAHPPGLSPLEPADWFRRDADFAAQMARREALLAEVPGRVIAATPHCRSLSRLYEIVLAHLAETPGYRVAGEIAQRPDGVDVPLRSDRPLHTLGRLIAEDLCLMEQAAAGEEYRLAAAVLCFPSRWLLSEKLGRVLTDIHVPVPDYDDTLARRVNRVFETVRAERPLVRVNWLVHLVAELHLPLGHSDKLIAETDPTGPLYLRTERQTLTRIAPGAVVFGIKTSICPLDALTRQQAQALRRELARLDPQTIAYRTGGMAHDVALSRLETLAA